MKGYIRQTKSGRWEGQVDLPRGQDGKRRRKSVYGDTRRECQRKVSLWIKKMEVDTKYEAAHSAGREPSGIRV